MPQRSRFCLSNLFVVSASNTACVSVRTQALFALSPAVSINTLRISGVTWKNAIIHLPACTSVLNSDFWHIFGHPSTVLKLDVLNWDRA